MNEMSVQNSIDLLQMSLSTFMSKQNKVRPFSAYAEFEFALWQRDCLAIILFENEMNEIGVCENDENRSNDCLINQNL